MNKSSKSIGTPSNITNISRRKQLTLLVDSSYHMQKKAEANEWQKVAQLQDQRQHLLKRFFATAATPQESPSIIAAINEMINIDKKIIELGVTARKGFREEIGNLNYHRKVANEYAANAG